MSNVLHYIIQRNAVKHVQINTNQNLNGCDKLIYDVVALAPTQLSTIAKFGMISKMPVCTLRKMLSEI